MDNLDSIMKQAYEAGLTPSLAFLEARQGTG